MGLVQLFVLFARRGYSCAPQAGNNSTSTQKHQNQTNKKTIHHLAAIWGVSVHK